MCKYDCDLSDDEVAGLKWLDTVLDAILEQGPAHRSYNKALGVTRALHKMGTHVAELHGAAHAMESRLIQYAHTCMMIQPGDEA